MASWDAVETGIGGDETANFGPRQESGTSLFQVDTLATISPQGEVDQNPHVTAACAPGGLCVVAAGQVSLFDEACQKFLSTLSFDSDVDVVAWSDNSLFLVVADRSGSIHFVDVGLSQILFSQTLMSCTASSNEKCFLQMMFAQSRDPALHDLLVLSKDGLLFRFSNINLEKLNEAIEAKDLQLSKEIQANIQMESVDVSRAHTESVHYFTITSTGRPLIITCGCGDASVAIWSQTNKGTILLNQIGGFFNGGGVIKCGVSGDGNFLFLLSDDHTLSAWHLDSLLMVAFWPTISVRDFLLMNFNSVNTGTKSSDGKPDQQAWLQLVALTGPEPDCQIKVFTLPNLCCTYTLTVSAFSVLADVLPNQETIFLIEGATDDEDDDIGGALAAEQALVSSLRIRCLTEALPETRFHRLLHKQKFEEAREFARLFKLDEELVYKVKATVVLEKASPWARRLDPEEQSALGQELTDCLDHVADESFVTEQCIRATLPSLEAMFRLMSYARARLSRKLDQDQHIETGPSTMSSLMTKVLEVLHRLGTFREVYGYQQYSIGQWDHFLHADLLKELMHWLSLTHIAKAVVIWRRHKADIEGRFAARDTQILEAILQAVPENTPSAQIVPWLREDLIPFVIHKFPLGKKFLAQWMEERARNMELNEKELWPGNSLEFAELFFSAGQLKSSTASGSQQLATQAQFSKEVCNLSAGNPRRLTAEDQAEREAISTDFDCTEAVCRLRELITSLKELQRLHGRYQCKLSLADFSKESASTLVFRMLDRVPAPELIQGTMEKVVRPYIEEHRLNEDKLLLQYIQDLLKFYAQGRRATYVCEAFWEAKAIAIIHCIKDIECKCLGIYSLMLSAFMPWNEEMEKLVHDGLSLKHPKVDELRAKYRLVQLNKMLSEYDLRHDDVRKNNAQMVIRYILASDQPNCLQDALQVTKAYNHLSPANVYVLRLKALIKSDRIQEVVELLASMKPSEAVSCSRRVVTWSEVILSDPDLLLLGAEDKVERVRVTKGMASILKFLLSRTSDPSELRELQDRRAEVKRLLSLQVDYGEFLSLESLRRPDVRKSLLTKHLVAFYKKDSGTTDKDEDHHYEGDRKIRASTAKSMSRLYSLARLLGIPYEEMQCQLARRAAEMGQVKTALKKCRELCEYTPSPAVSEAIYRVVAAICRLWADAQPCIVNNAPGGAGDIPSLSTELYGLAAQALAHCDQGLLCDSAELCKLLRLTDAVYHQCESGDYGISVQLNSMEAKRDPYQDWTFTDIFKENSLVLTSSYALPTTCKFLAACLPDVRCDARPLQHSRMAGRPPYHTTDVENPPRGSGYLHRLSSASLELIQHLQENSHYEMAFGVLAETLATSLQYTAANTMAKFPGHQDLQALISKEQEYCSQVAKMGLQKLNDFAATLMDKIFSSRRVDHRLALSVACVMSKANTLDKLKSLTVSAGHNYRKVLAIAKVGTELGRLHSEPSVEQLCKKLETNATWGSLLGKLKISFQEVFNAQDTQDKRQLLPQIVQHPAADINMINNYCSAFELDTDEALLMYLETLLLPPSAKLRQTPPETDQSRALTVIRVVTNKELLMARLAEILDKVDSYDYQRLNFVLKCIQREDPNNPSADVGLQLLEYLVHYTRITEPSEYEIMFHCTSDEQQLRGATVPLSPMSKERLPFHPLMKGGQWKILARELNEETVHQLQPVAKLLKLPTDHLFVTTINNLMKRAGSGSGLGSGSGDGPAAGSGGESKASRIDKKTLEVVQQLLLSISSPEMAVATARVVVKELPMGPLKVMALEICVLLARLWKEKCPENSAEKQKAELTHQKLSQVCRCLATEQVLHRYQLAETELLKLVDQPAKLTFKLYEHPSIEVRILDTDDGGLQDIHAAANAVADVNDYNIDKIRLHLIEQWLPSAAGNKQAGGEDTTVNLASLSFLAPKEDKTAEEERSLARVKYLLQYGDVKGSARFLLNFAYKEASSKISNACRVRALRCLFNLLNADLIQVVADKSVEAIREFMQNLMYLVEFESLNASMDLGVFASSNKQGLVRGLWKHYNHEPRAVRLIANLCLDYSVHDPPLWNSVLQQLLKFGMVDYLRHVLVTLADIPELWQLQCLPRLWKSVLMAPFAAICPPLSAVQEGACGQSAALLQRCPVVYDLDMLQHCRQFLKAEMYAYALSCLLYITDAENRDKQIRTLLSGSRHIAILDEILEMQRQKKLLISAEQIKTTLFQYVEGTGAYASLLPTPYFPELIEYLVKEDSIEGLLKECLMAKRFKDAVRLIQVYYSYNPGSPSAVATEEDSSKMLQLKGYMEHHGLAAFINTLPPS